MSCGGTPDCTCGCCSGISVETPQGETNAPGLSSIVYRTGTWNTFKDSMLARLSSSDYPALAALKTRDSGDFSIAFLDAAAVVMDILTFYQERLANESYLRTATQLRSLTELSRLIGYSPAPGVAASAYLAFTLKAATGLPINPNTPPISIPQGTQVQSVPVQGQTAQTFETSAAIAAKPDWNQLPVQTGNPWRPGATDLSMYLVGTATQLQPGDSILIVGDERAVENINSPLWAVTTLTAVTPDSANNRTLISWNKPLAQIPLKSPRIYALRQRAALFGYNAINPLMLTHRAIKQLSDNGLLNSTSTDWNFLPKNDQWMLFANTLDLDATYSKVGIGGWMTLMQSDLNLLCKLQSVSTVSRSDFAMSAKVTRVETDVGLIVQIYEATRTFPVLVQSEELTADETPLDYPLYGTHLDLEVVRNDLAGLQAIAVIGKSQKLTVNKHKYLTFKPDDPTASPTPINPGDVITITSPSPLPLNKHGGIPHWHTDHHVYTLSVLDPTGRPGSVTARLKDFTLLPSSPNDPVVQESALVGSVATVGTDFPHTRIVLQNALAYCYDRTSTSVNANVGLATAGATVTEILGNGAAATPNQSFTLKQTPLTYVQAPTPTGSQSTLVVRANNVAWKEVPSLYNQPPTAQVFATLNQSDQTTDTLFGDNVEGATLPTGQNNIQATYRVGSGLAGNVASAAITTLIDRPVGVSGVVNPDTATGGQDPQSIDGIRTYAPQSVLTLGRVVSIEDYQNYASTFASIAKANAIWIPSGPGRGVFLTVAAAGGVDLPQGNPTLANLVTSLQNYGNPLVPIWAYSFLETLFSLSADIKYDPAYVQSDVEAAVMQMLTANYSFASRTFGQGVSADEVAADIQGVAGVIAVNIKQLSAGITSSAGDLLSIQGSYSTSAYIAWIMGQVVPPPARPSSTGLRICPYVPVASNTGVPLPAEILVIDPNPQNVVLGVMT